MERLEETMVKYASPTLTGHKAGSLFSYRPTYGEDLPASIAAWNEILRTEGLHLRLMDDSKELKQILLYRPCLLEAILHEDEIRTYLQRNGYPIDADCEALVEHLQQRFACYETFPHELGLFLGYPLADVLGFIHNKGRNYVFNGLWKVYSQPERAKETAAIWRKCREHCLACFRQGQTILQLIQAA